MVCQVCQVENRSKAQFCRNCGARLLSGDEPLAAPVATAEEPPVSAPEGESLAPEPGQVPSGESASQAAAPSPVSASTVSPSDVDGADPPAPDLDGLPPLASGTTIGARFEIVELVEAGRNENLYTARDLALCPRCGFEGNPPEEEFCGGCGADLKMAGPPVVVKILERRPPEVDDGKAPPAVTESGRRYFPVPGAEPTGEPARSSGLVLSAGFASDVGMVRELDEDSLFVLTLSGVFESVAGPTIGLFIVADGMGGHEGGEVASRLAVQVTADRLIREPLLPRLTEEAEHLGEVVRARVEEAVVAANEQVHRLAEQRGIDMGCTLTLALVIDGKAYIANVGDSRTYLYRGGELRQITVDHSVVASLVAAGDVEPPELYTHPSRHTIYRAIAYKPTIEVDLFEEALLPGDTLLLCCDGVWETIRDDGIEEVLLTHFDPRTACAEMVRQANLTGGEDNISVIVVRVEEMLPHVDAGGTGA